MKVKIINVKVVRGRTLNKYWHSDMQVIATNKGEFIDNIPYGGYQDGHDWEKEIGNKVKVETNHSRGYEWINYIKTKKQKTISRDVSSDDRAWQREMADIIGDDQSW